VPLPVGLSQKDVIQTLAVIRAIGEIMQLAPAALDGIVDKARLELEFKPDVPIVPPVVTP